METPDEDADDNASDEGDGEETDDEEGEQEPEDYEINIGGERLKVPKGSVPQEVLAKVEEFSKGIEASYTKKFQDVSERSKALEAREETVTKLQSLSDEAQTAYARGLHLKTELDQLRGIDLNALWQSDPDKARRASDLISQKESELSNVIAQVSKAETEFSRAQEAETSRRMEEGRQVVEKRIPGFSEKANEVVDYAVKEFGISKQEAEQWPLNPMTAEMAYKAMMYDKMQTAQKTKPATKAQPAKPFTAKAKGKGGKGTQDVSSMSPGEMAKYLGLPG